MLKISYKSSLEKNGREYGLQLELLRGGIEHSVINESNLADLRHIWEPYPKLDVVSLAFIYARHSMEMRNKSGFGIRDCLTQASLKWKCFGTNNKDREFYTFDDNFVRDFICKSIKEERVAALTRYFESNQCDELLDTIKKHLKINEKSKRVDEYLK